MFVPRGLFAPSVDRRCALGTAPKQTNTSDVVPDARLADFTDLRERPTRVELSSDSDLPIWQTSMNPTNSPSRLAHTTNKLLPRNVSHDPPPKSDFLIYYVLVPEQSTARLPYTNAMSVQMGQNDLVPTTSQTLPTPVYITPNTLHPPNFGCPQMCFVN